MQIGRMRIGAWGQTRAFFDIVTEEGFVLRGFRVVQTEHGPTVRFPQVHNPKNDKYYPAVETVNFQLSAKVELVALKLFDIRAAEAEGVLASTGTAERSPQP